MTKATASLKNKHLLEEQPTLASLLLVAPPMKRFCASLAKKTAYSPLHALIRTSSKNLAVAEIKACLHDYPKAANAVDANGRTPIFHAIRQDCSSQVVQILFDAFPDAIVHTDVMGQDALGLLYHPSKSVNMLEYVLHRQPSLALWQTKTFSRRKLVDAICDNWSKTANPLNVASEPIGWTKLMLTIKAAHFATFNQSIKHDEEFHVALELGLSNSLLHLMLSVYPHQASLPMRRCENMLPLHFVVSHTMMKKPTFDATLVRRLVETFPRAAGFAHHGHLPLHAALAAGRQWTDGVKELSFAFPAAIHMIDANFRLYPVLIAASSDVSSFNTVFSLLKECPIL
ncbi:hypothetical protein MPSEU_000883700 [Mayamaea pseudoterrestris]|nr:hypothetical protein MPSEU_000883700 [Mayamaea pseudoterrestris]